MRARHVLSYLLISVPWNAVAFEQDILGRKENIDCDKPFLYPYIKIKLNISYIFFCATVYLEIIVFT